MKIVLRNCSCMDLVVNSTSCIMSIPSSFMNFITSAIQDVVIISNILAVAGSQIAPLRLTCRADTQHMSQSNRTVHSEAMGLMQLFENLVRARGWVKSKPSVPDAPTWYSLLEGEVIGVSWSSRLVKHLLINAPKHLSKIRCAHAHVRATYL
jgi:hypothetical protein